MEFHLVRIDEVDGVRQFAFDRIHSGASRTEVIVRADVTMARKYDIRLQELPLLCRLFLDGLPESELSSPVTLSEHHMMAIRASARMAAEKKDHKRPRNSPAAEQAWGKTNV